MPEFVRQSSEEEMVLEFIKAESASSEWLENYKFSEGFSFDELIVKGDLSDAYQNSIRRSMLNYRGYATRTGLFAGFPLDVDWSIYRFTIAEIADFKYANSPPWSQLSGQGRRVRDGAHAIDDDPKRVVGLGINLEKVGDIRERLRSGDTLANLIVATIGATYVVVEGQKRVTALAGLPSDWKVETFVGRAGDFKEWQFR
jgi:hypothetical protein